MVRVSEPQELLNQVDLIRLAASREFDPTRRVQLGQYFTSAQIAGFMANLLETQQESIHILDAGAGIGSLFSAAVEHLLARPVPPREIRVTAFEIDCSLHSHLSDTMTLCAEACRQLGVAFQGEIHGDDFIASAVELLRPQLFASRSLPPVTCAIINPPYLKISSSSSTRASIRHLGVETSNLYTGFMAAAAQLLEPGGEFIAITPRSFCNGPYFRSFRQRFLSLIALRRVHMFDSRQEAFNDDGVLQENVIVHGIKGGVPDAVAITSSAGPQDEAVSWLDMPYERVVYPDDPQVFIHLVHDEVEAQIAERMGRLRHTLDELGITVSTGRVVDFRAKEHLRPDAGADTAPLLYPSHLDRGGVRWPKPGGKKPNALAVCADTEKLLVPAGNYVLVKRFSSKEERRRVVAAVLQPHHVEGSAVGLENHLNYFHHSGEGLDLPLARGLAAFLNSTLVDAYFRQFNGHTQVNATDLRSLRYPSLEALRDLGDELDDEPLPQDELDRLLETRVFRMENDGADPIQTKQRISQAIEVLKDLGLPRRQLNERSALTLLALLDLRPQTPWGEAADPPRGVTQLMDFFGEHYGKRYAPNTRETVRRQTLHQFLDAGLVVINPDDPNRPTNSGKTVYQIERSALDLLRTLNTPEWNHHLRTYLASIETLKARYLQERAMQRIPIVVAEATTITLSPGGQNELVKEIVDAFASRFTPGGNLLYVGDTDEKFAYYDREALVELGVVIEDHGKMPDVIIHHTAQDWLVLIEAVTSHGPVNPKRRAELEQLFAGSRAGLVFVTAFLTRRAMTAYLDDISWETEVWVADHPTHLIHFNGERFLGPH